MTIQNYPGFSDYCTFCVPEFINTSPYNFILSLTIILLWNA